MPMVRVSNGGTTGIPDRAWYALESHYTEGTATSDNGTYTYDTTVSVVRSDYVKNIVIDLAKAKTFKCWYQYGNEQRSQIMFIGLDGSLTKVEGFFNYQESNPYTKDVTNDLFVVFNGGGRGSSYFKVSQS